MTDCVNRGRLAPWNFLVIDRNQSSFQASDRIPIRTGRTIRKDKRQLGKCLGPCLPEFRSPGASRTRVLPRLRIADAQSR
jgi:hypothetical protein